MFDACPKYGGAAKHFQIIGCKGGYALPCIIGVGYPSESAYYPEEYLKGKGKEYSNIPNLKAYGQAGKPCSRCGTIIRVILFIEK